MVYSGLLLSGDISILYLQVVIDARLLLCASGRSYKELMTKCNTLGRGEARSLSKLEKAIERIDKLKVSA